MVSRLTRARPIPRPDVSVADVADNRRPSPSLAWQYALHDEFDEDLAHRRRGQPCGREHTEFVAPSGSVKVTWPEPSGRRGLQAGSRREREHGRCPAPGPYRSDEDQNTVDSLPAWALGLR